MTRLVATAVLCLVLGLSAFGADWPQFLGPTRDSVSSEKVPAWKDSPKVLWKQPVGAAHSSPVVSNGVVYAFYQPKKKDADALAAFDAKTGELKWEKSYERAKFTPPFGSGPRGTPTVDGDKVFTMGSTGILACWDAKSGEVVWKVDTLKDFSAKNLFFGVSTSPTVVGPNVIVMVGGREAGIVAFKKTDGTLAWKVTSDPASYASPLVVGTGENAQILFLTGSNLRALSPSGMELWSVPFRDSLNESSTTPVKAGDLIVGSSVTAGSIALKLNSAEGKITPEKIWTEKKLTCYFSTPVVVGPNLYMVNGMASLTNASISLRCVEAATGKVLWTKENIGKYHAALIRTADSKLLMLDDTGSLSLLEPNDKEYKELAKSKVCGSTWAHPALSNGCVFVRDDKDLICLKLGE